MPQRSSNHGLTSIELLISLGTLAILVTVGMIFWTRYDREKWHAITEGDPQRVFTLNCQPAQPEFHGTKPIEYRCELTNIAPYAADFEFRGFSFRPADGSRPIPMQWASESMLIRGPDSYVDGTATIPIDSGMSVRFRIRHDSPFRGPTSLPRFGGAVSLEGTIGAVVYKSLIESNRVSITVNPPARGGATDSATIPTQDSP